MDTDFLSVECLEKLGLDQNPFIDHARDPFLFIDKQLEMSMNVLLDYLANQNSTIILLGEVGIGKTTHLRLLLRKGYQQFNFCTLRAKPNTTFADIEQKIKERWRLPKVSDENLDLLDSENSDSLAANEHISKYIDDDKYPVLIIDDAHRLQSSVLDELLKLKHHVGLQSERVMGLVLAAEPNIQTKLAELEQTNPAATQIYQINVRSFDTSQCDEYIRYRLDQAGATSQDIFNQTKITEIYSKSNGLPKHINKLAREELSLQCNQPSASSSRGGVLQSSPGMRLGLILAALIGIAVILSAIFKDTNQTDESIELDIAKTEQSQTEEQNTEPTGKDESEKPKQTVSTEEKTEEITKPYVAPLVLGPLQKDISESSKPKKIIEISKTEPDSETSNKKTKDTTTSNYSSDWILEQDANAYTIQIVASSNEKNLLDFIKNQALTSDTAYYQKTSSGKTIYVLVHGVFPTREEALNKIEQLSDTLKKNTPYPIQIKYLQEIITQQ